MHAWGPSIAMYWHSIVRQQITTLFPPMMGHKKEKCLKFRAVQTATCKIHSPAITTPLASNNLAHLSTQVKLKLEFQEGNVLFRP